MTEESVSASPSLSSKSPMRADSSKIGPLNLELSHSLCEIDLRGESARYVRMAELDHLVIGSSPIVASSLAPVTRNVCPVNLGRPLSSSSLCPQALSIWLIILTVPSLVMGSPAAVGNSGKPVGRCLICTAKTSFSLAKCRFKRCRGQKLVTSHKHPKVRDVPVAVESFFDTGSA